ncbi:hypothetical protein GGTG_04423 [Gaeumannomyces tritici R3-111a-1]|uniref:Uncharacterized protein n=1 Tax=Gaeumannomyces tritici (strain R3-111a-1) TaxID=644352 RepID=J3NT25_GAET3|nr:hypothetical protein GGTG_04423 [Gaeumannomyces tritici R3-111a-1]EJT79338.1 hypothetical protein GGTG_04423 [Gaeumannomyces tritici R3-111a-1]
MSRGANPHGHDAELPSEEARRPAATEGGRNDGSPRSASPPSLLSSIHLAGIARADFCRSCERGSMGHIRKPVKLIIPASLSRPLHPLRPVMSPSYGLPRGIQPFPSSAPRLPRRIVFSMRHAQHGVPARRINHPLWAPVPRRTERHNHSLLPFPSEGQRVFCLSASAVFLFFDARLETAADELRPEASGFFRGLFVDVFHPRPVSRGALRLACSWTQTKN